MGVLQSIWESKEEEIHKVKTVELASFLGEFARLTYRARGDRLGKGQPVVRVESHS